MAYEDTITVPTPEGVELDYPLAGYGSRFTAELIDVILRAFTLLGPAIVLSAIIAPGTPRVVALIAAAIVVWFGYDVAYEVRRGGQTPGKRLTGLSVVMVSGRPVRLGSSVTRTVLRVIDEWLSLTVVGTVAIFATRRNQRLGDMAAGTVVIRQRGATGSSLPSTAAEPAPTISSAAREPAPVDPGTSPPAPPRYGLDITGLTSAELSAIREFLLRRESLTPPSRQRVANALVASMADRVGGMPPGGFGAERLLETIVAVKDAGGDLGDG